MANYGWSEYFFMHDFSHTTAGAKVANKKEQVVKDRVEMTAEGGKPGSVFSNASD